MPTLPIIPDLDVLENNRSRIISRREDAIIELAFERAEETLDAGIVSAVALATHALLHAMPFVESCNGSVGVLHAAT